MIIRVIAVVTSDDGIPVWTYSRESQEAMRNDAQEVALRSLQRLVHSLEEARDEIVEQARVDLKQLPDEQAAMEEFLEAARRDAN